MPKSAKSSSHVVVLHGWTLNPEVSKKWEPFLKLLKQTGLTVHFWPLPGLAKAPAKALTLDHYQRWLAEKTKDLPAFILLGHSFGGQLAVRFARLHPDRVKKLILIGSSGLIDRGLLKTLKRGIFKTIAKAGKKLTNAPAVRRILYRLAREADYYQASPTQRQTMSNILTDEIRADLPKLSQPTLLIWGKNDATTPLHLAQVFAENIPQASLKVIDEARHSPMYTHPEKVLFLVTEFIP